MCTDKDRVIEPMNQLRASFELKMGKDELKGCWRPPRTSWDSSACHFLFECLVVAGKDFMSSKLIQGLNRPYHTVTFTSTVVAVAGGFGLLRLSKRLSELYSPSLSITELITISCPSGFNVRM